MKRITVKEVKKGLLALVVVPVMLLTSGCELTEKKLDAKGYPVRFSIPDRYNYVDRYYDYAVRDGKKERIYKAENVFVLFDKGTGETMELLYNEDFFSVEVYDLVTLEMLVNGDCIGGMNTYNEDYYDAIRERNYQVHLSDAGKLIEGHQDKEYYTLDEIRAIEPELLNGYKVLNGIKAKQD